jgi:hypothetical protein
LAAAKDRALRTPQRDYFFNPDGKFVIAVTDCSTCCETTFRRILLLSVETSNMNCWVVMRNRQSFRRGNPDSQALVQRQRASLQPFRESLAFQEFHDQEVGTVLRSNVVELADVRMVQCGDRPCLALHALLQFRRRGKVSGQNFDGYRAVEPGVERTVNFPMPPAPSCD